MSAFGRGSRRGWLGAAVLPLGAAALLVGAAEAPPPYRDGPPPGFSGGFGEDTCYACHFSGEVNDGVGSLTLEGLPESYEAGRTYPLTVRLSRAEMKLGGFQLAARLSDSGEQAGELRVADEEATVTTDRGVQYAYQALAGSEAEAGTTSWRVEWVAPAAVGAVRFDVAGNAANGDDTAEGDAVYHLSATVGAAR